ncbi:MAG: RHS repeat-associated core domain-containing protein [Blastocatellia bacterium]|nr:RHS repeat-associated core domain-containing protein [Blastocatellia bacterium]
MPFGEELYTGVGGRTGDTGLKYSSNQDDIRQKFTGHQKDKETGLDFAEARMYENRLGRFTAVDPLLASGRSSNPQTFNRYIYTSNNPIVRSDPTGLDWYRQPIANSQRFTYKWFGEDPGDDWEAVDFGDKLYFQITEWVSGTTEKGNGYLDRYANKILTQSEYDAFLNRPLSLGCAGYTTICLGNPAAIFDRARGWRTGAWNFFAGTVNAPIEFPIFHTVGGSFSARRMFNLPLFVEYAEYQNRAEAQSAFQTQGLLTVGSIAGGGGLNAAATRIPRLGTKLDYAFGRATGDLHNIQRSTTMQQQLGRIGIFDDAAGRAHVGQTFKANFSSSAGTLQTNGRIMREGLIMGPNGGLKFQTVWDGNRLVTMNFFGKGMPQSMPRLSATELNKLGF